MFIEEWIPAREIPLQTKEEDVYEMDREKINEIIARIRGLDRKKNYRGEIEGWGWDPTIEPEMLGKRGMKNTNPLGSWWHSSPPKYCSKWTTSGILLEELQEDGEWGLAKHDGKWICGPVGNDDNVVHPMGRGEKGPEAIARTWIIAWHRERIDAYD